MASKASIKRDSKMTKITKSYKREVVERQDRPHPERTDQKKKQKEMELV